MKDILFDDIGPAKIVHYYFPKENFRAFVVVDNAALGPSIGGVRVSSSVTVEEVYRLARAMSLKNSMAGIPHGGGKAGIAIEPDNSDKEKCFKIFARSIKDLSDYIPGPDMGCDEEAMAWIHGEIGRAIGLPEEIGGLPLDKLGATGYGITQCAKIACDHAGIKIKNSRIAIQGFGSVGQAAAKFLTEKDAVIVSASDSKGTIYNRDGLDINELMNLKINKRSVVEYKKGQVQNHEDIFLTDCEILVPAAIPDVIRKDNVEGVKAKVILQGANIPVTIEAEKILYQRGIISIPDFVANAGGVIMGAMEYANKTEREAFKYIKNMILQNTDLVLEKSNREEIIPREAAEIIAKERILNAMKYRGY